uniref:Uncharacterized protein n=1 Tax=Moniliophthora roreri TaxID=221103 RepID=A0A0W0G809_MONRR
MPTSISSTRRTRRRSIPPEIIQRVVFELRHDRKTLKSLSLVGRTWVSATNRYLFNILRLNASNIVEVSCKLASTNSKQSRLCSKGIRRVVLQQPLRSEHFFSLFAQHPLEDATNRKGSKGPERGVPVDKRPKLDKELQKVFGRVTKLTVEGISSHLVGIRKLLVEASSAGPVGQEWTVELDIDIELQAEMKANAIHYLDFSLNPKITHIRLRGSWWFFLSLKDPIRTLATNAEDFDITRL